MTRVWLSQEDHLLSYLALWLNGWLLLRGSLPCWLNHFEKTHKAFYPILLLFDLVQLDSNLMKLISNSASILPNLAKVGFLANYRSLIHTKSPGLSLAVSDSLYLYRQSTGLNSS